MRKNYGNSLKNLNISFNVRTILPLIKQLSKQFLKPYKITTNYHTYKNKFIQYYAKNHIGWIIIKNSRSIIDVVDHHF